MTRTFSGFIVLAASGLLSTAAFAQTLDSEQAAFLTLINNYRAQNSAPALHVSAALQNSSQWMSNDMATKNYFSHTDSLGRDPFTRMAAFGYSYATTKGENIAAGNSDAQNTFNQWLNACDPDASGNCTYAHRLNMQNPNFLVIGIGRAYNASSTYRWYWTTDFGGFVDQTITPGGGSGGGTSVPSITSFMASPATITVGQSTTLSWNVSGATSLSIDNGIGNVSSLISVTVSPAATTTYRLTASNTAGSTSAAVTVTVLPASDTQPPSIPGSFSAVVKNSSEVDLSWTASTDNTGVAGYQIVRNGFALATVAANVLGFADASVSANTSYTYSVRAYDAAGNFSGLSTALQVTTPPAPVSNPVPASMVAVSGSQQSTTTGSPFGSTLQVKVLDTASNPVPGLAVTFTAPSSGASAVFAGGGTSATVATDASGVATSPGLTANNTGGTYSVLASAGTLSASFTLTNTAVSGPPPSTGTTISIWPDSVLPANASWSEGTPMEIGVKFRSDVSGTITGVRFYKGAANTGTHTGSLWSSSGALLATGTFTNETASGWQTLLFNTPAAISANTTYIASYHTNNGVYAVDFNYFRSRGADNAPLHALAFGVDGPNGVLTYGAGGQFPSASGFSNNYWVDVLFTTSTGGTTTPPPATPQSITVVAGTPQTAGVGTAFAATLQAKVLDSSSNPVSGATVTFTARASGASATFAGGSSSATAVTNSAGIATSPVLTANSTAGSYAVTASFGSLTPASFALTNTATSTPSPSTGAGVSIWSNSTVPANPSFIDGSAVELGLKFRADVNGKITGIRFYKGPQSTGTHTGSLWTSNGTLLATGTFTNETAAGWQTLTFSTPVQITANTTYVASYHTDNGIYAIAYSYFRRNGFDNTPLHALAFGADGPNGVYVYGPGKQFPANSGSGNNYWVDVVFSAQ